MMNIDSKYIQPGFVFKMDMEKTQMKGFYAPSIMHMKFINGQERKYYIGLSTWKNIQFEL